MTWIKWAPNSSNLFSDPEAQGMLQNYWIALPLNQQGGSVYSNFALFHQNTQTCKLVLNHLDPNFYCVRFSTYLHFLHFKFPHSLILSKPYQSTKTIVCSLKGGWRNNVFWNTCWRWRRICFSWREPRFRVSVPYIIVASAIYKC